MANEPDVKLFKCEVETGDTHRVYIGRPADAEELIAKMRKDVKRALRQGDEVRWPSGVVEWVDTVVDWGGPSGNRFTWHSDGNRILCHRVHRRRDPDGTVTDVKSTKVWRTYDTVMGD